MRTKEKRDRKRKEYANEIKRIFSESNNTYGVDRVCGALRKRGFTASYRRVARIMNDLGLVSVHRRRRQRSLSFNSCLHMMNTDGNDVISLTEEKEGVRDEAPSWSPDGKQIVFTRNHKLWILDLDSKEEQKLATSYPDTLCYSTRWSPDGKKIAFIGEDGLDQDIYIMDLQTGETTAITSDGGYKRSLLWTPDGKKLVYFLS